MGRTCADLYGAGGVRFHGRVRPVRRLRADRSGTPPRRPLTLRRYASSFPLRVAPPAVSISSDFPDMRRRSIGPLALAFAFVFSADAAAQRRPEALWYLTDREDGVQSFLAHVDRIDIVAPQTYRMDENGIVWGSVDPRVLAAARAHRIKVVPLVTNPGFDQPTLHKVLTTPEARLRAVRGITAVCRDNHYDGMQFDFENIHVTDRDAFTRFFRETADSLHAAGCSASAAVVPRASEAPGPTSYHEWMYENWRGAYDYKALADAADFLSLMTYDQHTRRTPPGPVAGLPWVQRCVELLLKEGVPPEKLSLGIPAYSNRWYPTWDESGGARVGGQGMSWTAITGVLARFGAKPIWDDRQKVSWASWENDGINEFAYIEDANSFREKLALVPRYRLRGYSVWVLGMEDPAVWNLPAARQAVR